MVSLVLFLSAAAACGSLRRASTFYFVQHDEHHSETTTTLRLLVCSGPLAGAARLGATSRRTSAYDAAGRKSQRVIDSEQLHELPVRRCTAQLQK